MKRRDIMGMGTTARMDDGDHIQFESFVRERSPGLQRLAKRLCVSGGIDPNDLVQETFERAFRHFDRLVDVSTGEAIVWLSTTLNNRFLDYCRRQRTEQLGRPALRVVQDMEVPAEPAPLEQWERVSMEQLRQAIDALPPRLRDAYRLHASGLRYREIARRLEAPDGTVGRWISEARQRLREQLGAGGPPEGGRDAS